MKNLLTIKEQDINSDAPVVDTSQFEHREASRAVVLDPNGGVYLLKSERHSYHKLPGGGIEEGEDILEALRRELLEEIGCEVEVIAELGKTVEYRDEYKMKQTSYCFLVQQIGEQILSSLEDEEILLGIEEVKVGSISEAIILLAQDDPEDYTGKFITIRDLEILTAAKKQLDIS